jgi:uncharacterized membrane protein
MRLSAPSIALIAGAFFAALLGASAPAHAQELHQNQQGVWRAEVIEVQSQEERLVPGTQVETTFQQLRARILEGPQAGETVTVENDYLNLQPGDAFFMNYLVAVDGEEIYTVREPDRRAVLAVVAGAFALAVIAFGGFAGLRALLSMAASFFVILYLLIPQLAHGAPPVITSVGFAVLILGLVMSITHGISRKTAAAFLGTVGAIAATGVLGFLAVEAAQLSGFVSDEAALLNFSSRGTLDLSGLLLGAIIVGVLGVLDDIAITQVSAVAELKRAAEHLSRRELFTSALRIGKEHIGALVNTLALAYAGASLPLLILFTQSETSPLMLVNREIFAAEIIRTAIGGIGLVLTVTLTTLLAVLFLRSAGKERQEHAHTRSFHA